MCVCVCVCACGAGSFRRPGGCGCGWGAGGKKEEEEENGRQGYSLLKDLEGKGDKEQKENQESSKVVAFQVSEGQKISRADEARQTRRKMQVARTQLAEAEG